MTLSLGLTFALFFLTPGLGFFGGLFYPPAFRVHPQAGRFSRDPPAPGSMLTLAIVGVSALLLHALWSGAIFAGQLTHDHVGGLTLPRGLALYATAHDLGQSAIVPQQRIAAGLAQLLLLTVFGYWLGGWTSTSRPVRRALLGWLHPIDEALRGQDRFLAAFVLSKVSHEGVSLGYRGIVVHARLDGERQIAALVLEDARKYTVRLHGAGGSTTRNLETRPLPLIQLERDEIANIALIVLDTRNIADVG